MPQKPNFSESDSKSPKEASEIEKSPGSPGDNRNSGRSKLQNVSDVLQKLPTFEQQLGECNS